MLNHLRRTVVILLISSVLLMSLGIASTGFSQAGDDMYWKASFPDYALSGVPDFDQRQNLWVNPVNNKSSWCGPVAVADSLWWMDSRYEKGQTPPPIMSDTFPLVKSYKSGVWDDHDVQNVDPFVRQLAFLMDTDGQRTGLVHSGTNVMDMQAGIAQYLVKTGVNIQGDADGDGAVDDNDRAILVAAFGSSPGSKNWNMAADLNQNNAVDVFDAILLAGNYGKSGGAFYEKTVKMPTFQYVKTQIEKCEDVILLLGFWQWTENMTWVRVGGHYVTAAGVNATTIAFNDPVQDAAEFWNLDGSFVPAPHPYPHPSTLHNDSLLVSHDPYPAAPTLSPGGLWGPQGYELLEGNLGDFLGQNVPKEFEPVTGGPIPQPFFAEVEYAVIVSPTEWYFKLAYNDYAQSGVPDFDMKQDNWIHPVAGWTWCGPVSAANSLWWLDSKFESNFTTDLPTPPPSINDNFTLLTAYGPWDDHDPRNVEPFVNNLAFLMDTDGQRTKTPAIAHSGTFIQDLEVGISQYMQQQGVNPRGDCDGDGDVDGDDLNIIMKAFNTVPGSKSWNMAADLNQDNKVDMKDMAIAATNYGKVGFFYEHTEEFPEFPWIENETYACEDVEVLLEFWQDIGGGNWSRWIYDPGGAGGHYVTVAGVNSTTSQLVISDPWWDAFEAEKVPGRSPVIHPYPHNADVHNDTRFVSHDAYTTVPWMLPVPTPYPSQPTVWELLGYLQAQGFDNTWHAFIRAAVSTSPNLIGVGLVTTDKDKCTPIATLGLGFETRINVTVLNQGLKPQTVNVTVYANSTAIQNTTINLPQNSSTILSFKWNCSGFAYGDYVIGAKASASYNRFNDYYVVKVVIPGDINGDGKVNILDAIIMANAFLARPNSPYWNPNADINGDDVVNILDAIILSNHFLQQNP